MYLDTFETIHFHFLQIPSFQTFDNPYQALALATYWDEWSLCSDFCFLGEKTLLCFEIIGSCLYLLVLARGLFLRRLSPLVVIWFTRVLLSIFGHKSPEFAILKEQPSEKGCRTYTDDVIISIQILFTVHFPFHIWREGKQTNNAIPKMEFHFPKVHLIIVGQNGPWDVILIRINY